MINSQGDARGRPQNTCFRDGRKARARIEEIETTDAISMLGDDTLLFVDLRGIRERQRSGFIPGSFHCPRGMLEFWVDPESPYCKEVFDEDRIFVSWEKTEGPIEHSKDK